MIPRRLEQRGGLRVAYAIQNVGGIDFSDDLGDTVPVKHTLFGLRERGHDVTCFRLAGRSVVAIDDVSQPRDVWSVAPRLSGSRGFRLAESAVRRVQRRVRAPYLALWDSYRFYEACRTVLPQFDLCHEHNGLLSVGAALAARRARIPYVLTFSADPIFERAVVGAPLRGVQLRLATWEAQTTINLASRIFCVSAAAKRQLVETWHADPEKVIVMPNGVDTLRFRPLDDAHSIRTRLGVGSARVVGFVGSFQPWHGLQALVESFARVVDTCPDAMLLLVGDGPDRPALSRKVAELGLTSRVIITGVVPQSEVPDMLAAVDVAVIPYPRLSRELWFSPLKLYEYMAAGKAIVASESGQIAEVLEDGQTGLLVEPGEIGALSSAIVRLLDDSELRARLGLHARERAIQHHSWGQYVRRVEQTYESVLGGRK